MGNRFKSKYILLLAYLLSNATVLLPPCQAQAISKPAKKSVVAGNSKAAKANLANASEGVQLIEEIFQKLRNVPQLALAKSKQLLAFQNAPMQQQQWGAADSNLIIKPAQSSLAKPMSQAMRKPVAIVADKPIARDFKGNNLSVADGVSLGGAAGNVAGGLANVPQSAPAGVRARVVWEPGRQQQQRPLAAAMEKDEEQEMGLASGVKNIANYDGRSDQSGSVVSNAPLIKEFREQSATTANAIAGSAGMLQSVPVAKTKVAQVNLDDALRRSKSPAFRNLEKTLSGANLPQVSLKIQTTTGATQAQYSNNKADYAKTIAVGQNAGSPQMVSTRGTLASAWRAAPQAFDSLSASAPTVDERPSQIGKKKESYTQRRAMFAATPITASLPPSAGYQLRPKDAREELALLPLTKFSGIPLVNLGDSDSDLSKRLAQAGTVEITVVKPWTVWSVKKRGSQECGLQVFSQKGVVEAVRVEDKSIWTSQQGIVLGDEVSVVKEKFGEPAFILSHPLPQANKVYVYPISQVAFRLERAAETDPPRIKDIIIFNVK